jgi:hypothetical protein
MMMMEGDRYDMRLIDYRGGHVHCLPPCIHHHLPPARWDLVNWDESLHTQTNCRYHHTFDDNIQTGTDRNTQGQDDNRMQVDHR